MATLADQDSRLVASLKDSLVAGVLTLALSFFLIGLNTNIAPGGLVLEQRWLAVAVAVAVVFAGRFLLNYFVWRRPGAGQGGGLSFAIPKVPMPSMKIIGPLLFAAAVVLPFLLLELKGARGSRQYLDLAVLITTYVMLGWGLNIVVGLAGLLDLGYVAFYAVGAYSFALLAQTFDLGFWISLPLAGILAAFWGIILGFPVLRLRGDYLAIVTLAFGEIVRIVLLNWYQFTGGPDGISGIPRPTFFGIDFTRGEGGFAETFGLEYSPIHLSLLRHSGAGTADQLCHLATAATSDRAGLGGAARR